ncbi:hypothetical protein F0562_011824 [Nyssa sinensis]|uniref:Uncharacterized protein n=1 Tax=Nyssa sinensis TaxID=561372 RepID=A0A5J4ZVJ2_9ASTE|nr:hypothetical protein F0562_011824 [Nyssa sinensis]
MVGSAVTEHGSIISLERILNTLYASTIVGTTEDVGDAAGEDIPSLGDVNFDNSGRTVGEDSDEQAGHVEVEEEEEDQESDRTLVSTLAHLDEEIEAQTTKLEALKQKRSLLEFKAQIMKSA